MRFSLPDGVQQAQLLIYDLQGNQIKALNLSQRGEGQISLQAESLNAGMYIYALVADGKVIDEKKMILTK
ncbi:MAG: T9SS type A sorting domain-containing protein [Bacteroidia bacterium]|nr:T9SS type A sorting domain-containing protein [Bacteroidia bacterium]